MTYSILILERRGAKWVEPEDELDLDRSRRVVDDPEEEGLGRMVDLREG